MSPRPLERLYLSVGLRAEGEEPEASLRDVYKRPPTPPPMSGPRVYSTVGGFAVPGSLFPVVSHSATLRPPLNTIAVCLAVEPAADEASEVPMRRVR
jgi:hypothetical protein